MTATISDQITLTPFWEDTFEVKSIYHPPTGATVFFEYDQLNGCNACAVKDQVIVAIAGPNLVTYAVQALSWGATYNPATEKIVVWAIRENSDAAPWYPYLQVSEVTVTAGTISFSAFESITVESIGTSDSTGAMAVSNAGEILFIYRSGYYYAGKRAAAAKVTLKPLQLSPPVLITGVDEPAFNYKRPLLIYDPASGKFVAQYALDWIAPECLQVLFVDAGIVTYGTRLEIPESVKHGSQPSSLAMAGSQLICFFGNYNGPHYLHRLAITGTALSITNSLALDWYETQVYDQCGEWFSPGYLTSSNLVYLPEQDKIALLYKSEKQWVFTITPDLSSFDCPVAVTGYIPANNEQTDLTAVYDSAKSVIVAVVSSAGGEWSAVEISFGAVAFWTNFKGQSESA